MYWHKILALLVFALPAFSQAKQVSCKGTNDAASTAAVKLKAEITGNLKSEVHNQMQVFVGDLKFEITTPEGAVVHAEDVRVVTDLLYDTRVLKKQKKVKGSGAEVLELSRTFFADANFMYNEAKGGVRLYFTCSK